MAIETRHQKSCPKKADKDARCNCSPSYRAVAWKGSSEGKRQRVIKIFPSQAAARAWLTTAEAVKASGRRSTIPTLREAADLLFEGMREGIVLNRNREQYKRTAVQTLEGSYKRYIDKELGALRLDQVKRKRLQEICDDIARSGKKPATIHNAIKPVSAIYLRAIRDDLVYENPCLGLEIERVRGKRDRIASPSEVKKLLAALPMDLRVLYGIAAYAGLRRGEIKGLRWDDVDFDQGVIRVERQYDVRNREIIETKSRRWRRVPLLSELRELLYVSRSQSTADTLVDPGLAFNTVGRRTAKIWKDKGLEKITLHELRHTFASVCIAAGLDLKQIGSFLGHSSVTTTMDTYGHLLPGSEATAAEVMNEYLARNEKKPPPGSQRRDPDGGAVTVTYAPSRGW